MIRIRPELRRRILKVLSGIRGLTQKQVGARRGKAGHSIWYLLSKKNQNKSLSDEELLKALPAVLARIAHAAVTEDWLESVEALDREGQLTPAEGDVVELALLEAKRELRKVYVEIVLRTRELPPMDGYPSPGDRPRLRWLAREQLEILKAHKEGERLAIVRLAREYQHWALMEAVAEESPVAASRSLEEAASWARLAVEVAERVRGPEEWQRRVRGYAAAFGPNVLRVAGELNSASTALGDTKRLWLSGSDPDHVLDPGRVLELEASLRRDQRQFDEALARLDEARPISRRPASVLIKKAFTHEVMGDYERAVEALREAEPMIDQGRDPRLHYMLRFNLAVLYTHPSRYVEANALLQEVRALVIERGDENEIPRLTWLQGRIAAGLGRLEAARSELERALRQFADRCLWYDVALSLLELSALLLREGKTAEVRALTPRLAEVFESKEVHREALAALQLFRDAAEKDTADEELARRVLDFLFRARHDKGLKFES